MENIRKLSEPVSRMMDVCEELRERFPQHEEAINNMEYYTCFYLDKGVSNTNKEEAIREVKELARGFSYHELSDYLTKRIYQQPVPSITVHSNGIPFTVRMVQKGERYGRDKCLVHDNDNPLVEFYDARNRVSEHGQFVSRYYLSTITEKGKTGGLQLEGAVPQWTINDKGMEQVRDWLKSFNSPYYGLERNQALNLPRREVLGKHKGLTL